MTAQLNGERIISLYGHSRVKRDRGDGGDAAGTRGLALLFPFLPPSPLSLSLSLFLCLSFRLERASFLLYEEEGTL